MSSVSPYLHKALLPVENVPIIIHILKQLPKTADVVVAVGHKADQIKDFFSVYPTAQNITFVDVPNYAGEGSGPGTTLLQCKEHLPEPFLIVCADTLWQEPLEWAPGTNTIFINKSQERDLSRFCNIVSDGSGTVTAVFDKRIPEGGDAEQFTGLAYVHDYDVFFKNLENANPIAGELQICSGFSSLIRAGKCSARKLNSWCDAGTPESYRSLSQARGNSFKKTSEEIFFVDGTVVKFFEDAEVCRDRVERFRLDSDVHPRLIGAGKQFYSYARTDGETLKSVLTPALFETFLDYCHHSLWIDQAAPDGFQQGLLEFYRDKTNDRFESFRALYPNHKASAAIGRYLDGFDWGAVVANGRSVRFHGDLQLDNVITDGRRFQLIDFRQSFAGRTDWGDLQYDCAKLLTSLMVDFDVLKTQDTLKPVAAVENAGIYVNALKARTTDWGLSYSVVESLVPVILINMMPLHHHTVAMLLAATVESFIAPAPMPRKMFSVSL